jgi:hypothetical protein
MSHLSGHAMTGAHARGRDHSQGLDMSALWMSEARVATENGARYLRQLCMQWAHKFVVQYTAKNGRIDFGEGRTVAFTVGLDHLRLFAKAPDADTLTRIEGAVADRLKRLALGESLDVSWDPVLL